MTNPPKYRLIKVYDDEEEFIDKINTLVDEGYKVHTYVSEYEQGEHLGIGNRRMEVLMSLSSSNKYDNADLVEDVKPHEVNDYLKQGYIIADSWAKNLRMVKKK